MPPENLPTNGPPHHWYDPQEPPRAIRSNKALWLRLVLVLAFAVVVFALGRAMVRHHYFTGGAQNNSNTGGPTGP